MSSSQPCFQGMMCSSFVRSSPPQSIVVRAIVRAGAVDRARATAALPALRWSASSRSCGTGSGSGADRRSPSCPSRRGRAYMAATLLARGAFG